MIRNKNGFTLVELMILIAIIGIISAIVHSQFVEHIEKKKSKSINEMSITEYNSYMAQKNEKLRQLAIERNIKKNQQEKENAVTINEKDKSIKQKCKDGLDELGQWKTVMVYDDFLERNKPKSCEDLKNDR